MKSRLMLLAALVAAPLSFAAEGPLKEKALAISAAHKDSVLFLTAVVEIELTAGDNPSKKEERKVELLGTVIGKDGLIVAPLSALDVASAVDGRMVNGPQGPMKLSAKGTTKEVKILMPDGSEEAAKVDFKDTDLDLAFIRPEKGEELKLVPVDTANSAPMNLLDDVIILGRLGKDLNREPLALTSEVISVVTKPRTFGRTTTQTLGTPVFNSEGKFLGIGINRFGPKGDAETQGGGASNVILPAADLMESASQGK
jgi:hypothetical protein